MSLLAAQALLRIGLYQTIHVADGFQARPRDFVELSPPPETDSRIDMKVRKLQLIAKAMDARTELHDISRKMNCLDRCDTQSRASRNRAISRQILECQSFMMQKQLNDIVEQIVDDRICA